MRRISSQVFIGREAELGRVALLRAEALASGGGATVLVSGEAGVGKTRFSAELAAGARADGWIVLQGSCDEFGGESRPFAALQEMVPAIEAFLHGHSPGELTRPAWRAISGLTTGERGGGGSVFQLPQALFQRMAAVNPLLVICDDLHWADESSRVLFETLARGLRNSPAIVVGSYRGNEVGHGHPLRPVLASVHRNARPELLQLPTFDRAEALAVVNAIAGELDAAAFDRLFERSGGNAFLLEELLASPGGELPQGVQDTVLARFDALNAAAARVAEAASLDTAASRAVLAAVTGLPPAKLGTALDELSDRGFLLGRGDSFAFRHPLLREVVYGRIPPGRRPVMHAAMADALERLEPERSAEAARHWREAAVPEREFRAVVRSGQQARNAGAMAESAVAFERALELYDLVTLARSDGRINRTDLAVRAALALFECRRIPGMIHLLRAELARTQVAAERALLGWWLASACRESTDPAEVGQSVTVLRAAAAAVDQSVPPDIAVLVLAVAAIELANNHGLDIEAAAIAARIPAGTPETLATETAFVLASARGWIAIALGAPVQQHLDLASTLAVLPMQQVDRRRMLRLLGPHERNIEEGVPVCGRLFDEGYGPMTGSEAEWAMSRSFVRLGRYAEGLDRLHQIRESTGDDDWLKLVTPGWGLMMVRIGRCDDGTFMFEPESLPFGDTLLPAMWGEYASARVEVARSRSDPLMARETVSAAIPRLQGHLMATGSEALAYAIGLEADHAFSHRGPEPEALALADDWVGRLQVCLDEAPGRAVIDDLGVFIVQARLERERCEAATTRPRGNSSRPSGKRSRAPTTRPMPGCARRSPC